LKTCNWNCVYCQLGRTRPLRTERRYNYPNLEILSEVKDALAMHKPGEIDWVTFVGSGETTLHAGMGEMIRGVKAMTDIPVFFVLSYLCLSLSGSHHLSAALWAGNIHTALSNLVCQLMPAFWANAFPCWT